MSPAIPKLTTHFAAYVHARQCTQSRHISLKGIKQWEKRCHEAEAKILHADAEVINRLLLFPGQRSRYLEYRIPLY